jgi:hypothetical protein
MKLVEGLVLVMKIQSQTTKNAYGPYVAIGAGIGTVIGIIAGVAFEMLAFLGVFIGLGASAGIAYRAAQTEMKNKQDR